MSTSGRANIVRRRGREAAADGARLNDGRGSGTRVEGLIQRVQRGERAEREEYSSCDPSQSTQEPPRITDCLQAVGSSVMTVESSFEGPS